MANRVCNFALEGRCLQRPEPLQLVQIAHGVARLSAF